MNLLYQDIKNKIVISHVEDKTNPRNEESKVESDKTGSNINNNNSETSINESIDLRKRGYSFKDKISMFSTTGTAPKKIVTAQDDVLAKSQVYDTLFLVH